MDLEKMLEISNFPRFDFVTYIYSHYLIIVDKV
jgi:hypothetical protein